MASPLEASPAEPVLDGIVFARLSELGQRLGEDVLGQVLAIFRAKVPAQVREIEAAVAGGDAARVARLAHSIKGSAGNVGASRLLRAASALEATAREGTVEAAAELVANLGEELTSVLAALPSGS